MLPTLVDSNNRLDLYSAFISFYATYLGGYVLNKGKGVFELTFSIHAGSVTWFSGLYHGWTFLSSFLQKSNTSIFSVCV